MARDVLQCLRAAQVAVAVVEILEMVDVEDDQGIAQVVALRFFGLAVQELEKMHLVVQAGQAVADGQLPGLLQQLLEQLLVAVQVLGKVAGDEIGEDEHEIEGQHGS